MKKYTTPKGKTIELYNDGFAVKAKFVEGGALPEILKGSWTSTIKAEEAVVKYIADKTTTYTETHTENGTPVKIKNPAKTNIEV